MLTVTNLTCGYGDILATRDVSFTVSEGNIYALLGTNGAGKTSTIMCLAGHVEAKSGSITFGEVSLLDVPAHDRIDHGLALVPEGRRVFGDLTVEENLIIGGHTISAAKLFANLDRIFDYFPRLAERKQQAAGSLSGGEQQMLAIGRALMADPKLIMIDELSLGLMPRAIDDCYAVLEHLRSEGLTILLVEQNTSRVLDIADRVCVLESGQRSWEGADAKGNTALLNAYLGQS